MEMLGLLILLFITIAGLYCAFKSGGYGPGMGRTPGTYDHEAGPKNPDWKGVAENYDPMAENKTIVAKLEDDAEYYRELEDQHIVEANIRRLKEEQRDEEPDPVVPVDQFIAESEARMKKLMGKDY